MFAGLTPGILLAKLRALLSKMGAPNVGDCRAHGLRRGHAEDLRQAGKTLREILQAEEWKSLAFLPYLDMEKRGHDLALTAHIENSSGDEN